MTCPSDSKDLFTLIILGELYTLPSFSLWSLLHFPFPSLLGPNICLRMMFSKKPAFFRKCRKVTRNVFYKMSKYFTAYVIFQNFQAWRTVVQDIPDIPEVLILFVCSIFNGYLNPARIVCYNYTGKTVVNIPWSFCIQTTAKHREILDEAFILAHSLQDRLVQLAFNSKWVYTRVLAN